MRTTTIRRSVAAGAALTVATIGLVAAGSPAQAAPVSLKFNCSASILTNQEFVLDADVTAPSTVEVGQKVTTSFTGTVTAPNTVRQSAYALLSGRSIGGAAAVDAKFGADAVALTADVANTEIPGGTTPQPLVLPATGGGSFDATTAGTQNLTISGFKGTLKMTKADGTVSDVAVTCVAKDAAAVAASVVVTPKATPTPQPVVKKKSQTTVKVKAGKGKATVTVGVKAGKTKGTGKVTIKLTKGKKTVKTVTKTLKKGSAKVTFKAKKGSYKVTAAYKGSKTLKASTGSKKVRIR